MPTQTKSPSTSQTTTTTETTPNAARRDGPTAARRAEALNSLLARHRPALHRQASRHAPRSADAEDALQDACVQFMRAYDGPPGTDALRWMMLVVKRCAWAIGERERPYKSRCEVSCTDAIDAEGPALVLADEGPDPLAAVERADWRSACLAAVDRLKPDERAALLLLGLGYSYREIGEMQGWTYTKVNRCIAEGRQALRGANGARADLTEHATV